MQRRAPFLVLAMILAGVTAPAQAQEGTHCTGELDIDLSPGIGSEPSSGTFHSDGESAKNTITFEFGGLSGGLVNGTFEGENFSGTFVFTPTEGDCVTAPATEGTVTLDGTMS